MTVERAPLRTEFPIFSRVQGPLHYLDSAATGQICRAAADALWDFETAARSNVKRGVYRLADEATNAFNRARASLAAYIGAADPDEVVFTSFAHQPRHAAEMGYRLTGPDALNSWVIAIDATGARAQHDFDFRRVS